MSNGFDDQSESARLCNRDPAAWESFYERVYPMMLAFAERRMGRGEPARDAVSEALARTVKTVGANAGTRRGPGSLEFRDLAPRHRRPPPKGVSGPSCASSPSTRQRAGRDDERRRDFEHERSARRSHS